MGTFQDADGTGNLLVHEGDIYRLTDEYTEASSATYVWLTVDGAHLSVPDFWPAWDARTLAPVDSRARPSCSTWRPTRSARAVTSPSTGRRAALAGRSDPHSGYGLVEITAPDGQVVATQLIDFYSKVADDGVRYMSPETAPWAVHAASHGHR